MKKHHSPNEPPNPTGSPRNQYVPRRFSRDSFKNDAKAQKEVHSYTTHVKKVAENIGKNPLGDRTVTVAETLHFARDPEQQVKIKKHIIKELREKAPRNE